MIYAAGKDVAAGFRPLSDEEEARCTNLLEEAAMIIDAYNAKADPDIKKAVSCRMVRRAIGSGNEQSFPMGSNGGTVSALGYSQTWTMPSNASTGELYLSRLEKKLLGVGDRIGTHSPVEELIVND